MMALAEHRRRLDRAEVGREFSEVHGVTCVIHGALALHLPGQDDVPVLALGLVNELLGVLQVERVEHRLRSLVVVVVARED